MSCNCHSNGHVSVKQTTMPSQISVPQSNLALQGLTLQPCLFAALSLFVFDLSWLLPLWPFLLWLLGSLLLLLVFVALWPFGPQSFGPLAFWRFGLCPFGLWPFGPFCFGPFASLALFAPLAPFGPDPLALWPLPLQLFGLGPGVSGTVVFASLTSWSCPVCGSLALLTLFGPLLLGF